MGLRETLTNWFYNSTTLPHRKPLSFVLGFLAAVLPLSTRLLSEGAAAQIFLWAVGLLLLVLLFIRPNPFRELKFDHTRWGIFSVSVLGYGLGALVYHYRAWLVWLWNNFREIDEPQEWILVSLFLLGVILGFFVVRNWSKNQQDFITSLTAVLGAAFLATILGSFQQLNQTNSNRANTNAGQPPATTGAVNTNQGSANQGNANRANTNLGNTTANANANPTNANLANANLTNANLTNANQASASRGGATQGNANQANANQANANQANAASGNTAPLELSPVTTFAFYALGFTISGILNLIAFSLLVAHYSRTESPTSRSVIDFLYGSDKAKAIDEYFLKNFEADPNYARVHIIKALTEYRDIIRTEFAERMTRRKEERERRTTKEEREQGPPMDYFELLTIENRESKDSAQGSPPLDPTYDVMFRKLGDGEKLKPEMFRVAISMKWLDSLEYIVAPGEYKKPFPYYGSVAGMALVVGKTIVMDRDRFKSFRTSDFVHGKTPNEADQPRGLDKIDFLSYVVTPLASSVGKPEEIGLGVLYLDTKLFACERDTLPKGAKPVTKDSLSEDATTVKSDSNESIYTVKLKKNELAEEFARYASNLYEQNDGNILYLESMRGVIVPLLELYKKCRTGAT